MNAFLTALQFLTRIHITNREFSLEDFGNSTKFFPLVGAVLGIIYAIVAALLLLFWHHQTILAPTQMTVIIATILLLLPILCTGGLMLDGLMDTFDGVASGRSRERMLEIMKDSRVGSFGVLALFSFLLLEWSFLQGIRTYLLVPAVLATPIIGRFGMTIAICCFPYARKQGMGKIFSEMATRKTLQFAFIVTLIFVAPLGTAAISAFIVGSCIAWWFARRLSKQLGGLTGDTYGAVETVTEAAALLTFVLAPFLCRLLRIPMFWW